MCAMRKIEFYQHDIADEEKRRILDVLDGPTLTNGSAIAEAEQTLAAYLGCEEVVCLDSCTAALHLALLAHDIGPGDEVIVPAMTFVATAGAVLMAGATPVFADVCPETGCLTVETIEAQLTNKTRAIIPVHLYGLLCQMEEISALAQEHALVVIEDAAHCIEARRGKVRPASHSNAACFSFGAEQHITCGEGGAFATHDKEVAARVRRLSRHGLTSMASDREARPCEHCDVLELGWKYNLDNIRASLLVPQIRRIDENWLRRRAIAERYESAFSDVAGIRVPRVDQPPSSARHLFPIWVDPFHRDRFLTELDKRGIGVTVHYRAIHLLEYFRRTFGMRPGDRPVAESIADQTLSLPFYSQLSDAQVDDVIDAVTQVTATACPPRRVNVNEMIGSA